jgi:hypothetical protein
MKINKPNLLPILVCIFSLIFLIESYFKFEIVKFGIATLGLISLGFYVKKAKITSYLFQIWIIAQIFDIRTESQISYDETHLLITKYLWHTNFDFFKPIFEITINHLILGLNIIPILLLGLNKYLKANKFVGKVVQIDAGLKRENKLGNVFPLFGEIIKPIQMDDKFYWMLTKLKSPLIVNGITYKHVLILPKESPKFKINKRHLSYMRLIDAENKIERLHPKKSRYPFIDFVGIKINA